MRAGNNVESLNKDEQKGLDSNLHSFAGFSGSGLKPYFFISRHGSGRDI